MKPQFLFSTLTILLLIPSLALAQQSHPLSEITPIDVNLDMYDTSTGVYRNIFNTTSVIIRDKFSIFRYKYASSGYEAGLLEPRCPCDTSLYRTCSNPWYTLDDVGDYCYDQWAAPEATPFHRSDKYQRSIHYSDISFSSGKIDISLLNSQSISANNLYISEKIGIGTSNPETRLYIRGEGVDNGLRIASDSGYAHLDLWYTLSGGAFIRSIFPTGTYTDLSLQARDIIFQTGTGTVSERMRIDSDGQIYVNGGWVRVSGNQGLYFQSYGGGWHMTDTTWIRAYNSKAVYSGGEIRSGSNMRAPIFYDLDNGNYYVDPASTSNLAILKTDWLYGKHVCMWISVECNGECRDNSIFSICSAYGSNYYPVAVACDDSCKDGEDSDCDMVKFGSSGDADLYKRSDSVFLPCKDGGGADAVVTCCREY